jgi:uncharacterized membrane protein (UPF0127 family)
MKKIAIIIFLLGVAVIAFFVFGPQNRQEPQEQPVVTLIEKTLEIKIAGKTINATVADTEEKRKKGLSGISALSEDEGMIFVFPESGYYSFWMKDMLFPIDIIWIDENKEVVYIKKNALPESFPDSFSSLDAEDEKTAKYVLEVFSGFADKFSLSVGDAVEFSL